MALPVSIFTTMNQIRESIYKKNQNELPMILSSAKPRSASLRFLAYFFGFIGVLFMIVGPMIAVIFSLKLFMPFIGVAVILIMTAVIVNMHNIIPKK